MSNETPDHQLHTQEEERAHRRALDEITVRTILAQPHGREVLVNALYPPLYPTVGKFITINGSR